MTTLASLLPQVRAALDSRDITRQEAVERICCEFPGITARGAEDLLDNGIKAGDESGRRRGAFDAPLR